MAGSNPAARGPCRIRVRRRRAADRAAPRPEDETCARHRGRGAASAYVDTRGQSVGSRAGAAAVGGGGGAPCSVRGAGRTPRSPRQCQAASSRSGREGEEVERARGAGGDRGDEDGACGGLRHSPDASAGCWWRGPAGAARRPADRRSGHRFLVAPVSSSGMAPSEVRIYEVGPRDGLQAESAIVGTDDEAPLHRASERRRAARDRDDELRLAHGDPAARRGEVVLDPARAPAGRPLPGAGAEPTRDDRAIAAGADAICRLHRRDRIATRATTSACRSTSRSPPSGRDRRGVESADSGPVPTSGPPSVARTRGRSARAGSGRRQRSAHGARRG